MDIIVPFEEKNQKNELVARMAHLEAETKRLKSILKTAVQASCYYHVNSIKPSDHDEWCSYRQGHEVNNEQLATAH